MALLIDYTTPAEAFCGADSACAKVRGSGYGYLWGGQIPMPALGLVAFGSLFILSLWKNHPLARRLWLAAANLGAVIGLGLIFLQVGVVKQVCWLCMVADVAAIVAASCANLSARKSSAEERAPELALWASVAWAAIALGAPTLWPRLKPTPPVPPSIAALFQPGKINVVEFFDFQCPHCRALQPKLAAFHAQYGDQVNFVRMNYPLRSHVHAMPSAKGHVCAKAQNKGDAFADELLSSGQAGVVAAKKTAENLGLDMQRYTECLDDPNTELLIKAEMEVLRKAGMQGLPTTYVGSQRLIGNQPDDIFADAFRRAEKELKSGAQESGVPASVFILVCLALFAGVGYAGWPKGQRRRVEEPAQ